MLKEISLSIKGLTIKGGSSTQSSFKIMKELIKETEDFHEKGFWDVVGGAKLYLLFDDLDIGWNPEDENQQLLLRGLFEIMKSYAYRERVKPLVALRTNILDGLKLNQKEKFENNILPIHWTKPSLERMLLLRFKKYGGWSDDEGFERIFETKPEESESPVDYMLERTLYRPRDLLAFCKYAISEAHKSGANQISIEHVAEAESIYANNRLTALKDEWKYLYPDLDSFITLIIKITKRDKSLSLLTPRDVKAILIEAKEIILTAQEDENYLSKLLWIRSYFPGDDPYEIAKRLYRLGVLGVRTGGASLTFFYDSEEMPNIDRETEFAFHPMLHGIQTGGFAFSDENPWD